MAVLTLNRKIPLWVCKECNKQCNILPEKCPSCGAASESFENKEYFLPEDTPRKTYRVLKNFLYEGASYNGPYNVQECQGCKRKYKGMLVPDAELGVPKCKCGNVKFKELTIPGVTVSLPSTDIVTLGMLKRELIKEIKGKKNS